MAKKPTPEDSAGGVKAAVARKLSGFVLARSEFEIVASAAVSAIREARPLAPTNRLVSAAVREFPDG
jgi:hypothetical protein